MSRFRWLAALACLFLLGGSVAVAQPPRAGLCDGLTGDALTRCLYSDLDDRVRALEPSPTASPSSSSASPSSSPSETGSSPSETPSSSPSLSPTPSVTPTTPSAAGWLSGASNDSTLTTAQFGTWRGSATEIVGTWINDPAIYPFGPTISGCGGCGQYRDFTGAADVAVVPPDWTNWTDEANGKHDAFFRATARALKAARAGKGTTYVRPWHEYNGDWMAHSVPNTAAGRAAFVKAWERIDAIFATEFPEAKMMLGTAAAGGTNRVTVADAWPTGVDVLSIDFYNEWPWCNTQACFDDKAENSAGANSLYDLQRLAKAKGVPIMISEWGNANHSRAAGSGGGGDAPQFFASFYAWLKANAGTGAGQVLGEVYFNIPEGYDAQFWLVKQNLATNPEAPQTVARYRSLWAVN